MCPQGRAGSTPVGPIVETDSRGLARIPSEYRVFSAISWYSGLSQPSSFAGASSFPGDTSTEAPSSSGLKPCKRGCAVSPPGIGPLPIFVDGGYVVDELMVLHIDEAYILLSGARIVPEPHSSALLAAATLCLLRGGACRRRM